MFGEKCGITPGLYKMPDEPVGPKILIPGFESAVAVRGAFGWFSAGWIQRLAPGLAVYLARESVAPIDFTVSPQFFAAERAVVESSITSNAEAATQRIAHLFADGRIQATALGAHALDCMAWMIATSQLKLRIAVPTRESNYHPKIWLFDDGYHQVLARGSGNAIIAAAAVPAGGAAAVPAASAAAAAALLIPGLRLPRILFTQRVTISRQMVRAAPSSRLCTQWQMLPLLALHSGLLLMVVRLRLWFL